MSSIGEEAKAYEPQRMKNIVDLDAVLVQHQFQKENRLDKDKQEYAVSFIVVEGEEYRVPNSVLEQLQALLEEKPNMTSFKVLKKGEGLNTSYQVISLD